MTMKEVPSVSAREQAWSEIFHVLERVHAKHPPPTTLSPREEEEWIARQIKAFRKK